jgi:hypothetical protein
MLFSPTVTICPDTTTCTGMAKAEPRVFFNELSRLGATMDQPWCFVTMQKVRYSCPFVHLCTGIGEPPELRSGWHNALFSRSLARFWRVL